MDEIKKTWIPPVFATLIYAVSKLIAFLIEEQYVDPITRNLMSLGFTYIIFVIILTGFFIKYRKSKTLRSLKVLYLMFYMMSVFQMLVYFAYAYTLIEGADDLGINFMDARNWFYSCVIMLFVVNAGTYTAMRTNEEMEQKELELVKRKVELAKLEKRVSKAYLAKDWEKVKLIVESFEYE